MNVKIYKVKIGRKQQLEDSERQSKEIAHKHGVAKKRKH